MPAPHLPTGPRPELSPELRAELHRLVHDLREIHDGRRAAGRAARTDWHGAGRVRFDRSRTALDARLASLIDHLVLIAGR